MRVDKRLAGSPLKKAEAGNLVHHKLRAFEFRTPDGKQVELPPNARTEVPVKTRDNELRVDVVDFDNHRFWAVKPNTPEGIKMGNADLRSNGWALNTQLPFTDANGNPGSGRGRWHCTIRRFRGTCSSNPCRRAPCPRGIFPTCHRNLQQPGFAQ
jgi:hypothetical protein